MDLKETFFAAEIQSLTLRIPLPNSSKVLNLLNPFLNSNGILHGRERLRN